MIHLFSTLEAEIKLSVNVFQPVKSDLRTNLDCASFLPPHNETSTTSNCACVTSSSLSCLHPSPAVLLQNFPGGWLAAGGNRGQDSKKRDEELGERQQWLEIQKKCACCSLNQFSQFPPKKGRYGLLLHFRGNIARKAGSGGLCW